MNIFLVAYYLGVYSPVVHHLIPQYIQPPFRRRRNQLLFGLLAAALFDLQGHSQELRPASRALQLLVDRLLFLIASVLYY